MIVVESYLKYPRKMARVYDSAGSLKRQVNMKI